MFFLEDANDIHILFGLSYFINSTKELGTVKMQC